MVTVREATPDEAAAWLEDWRRRLFVWYDRFDVMSDWLGYEIQRRVGNHLNASRAYVFTLHADDEPVGYLAAAQLKQFGPPTVLVSDVWVAPEHRRQGHATAALDWARSWATRRAKRFVMVTNQADPVHAAVAKAYPVRSRNMIKRASPVDTLPRGLVGRRMTEGEFAPWLARQTEEYAQEMAASGMLSIVDANERAQQQLGEFLAQGLDTPNHTFWCLGDGPDTIARLWLGHHFQATTTWVNQVEVVERHRGQGYGRAAMLLADQATIASGDTHLGLNVFAHNDVAFNLYQRIDYRTTDQSRSVDL